jgi:hypothetical protein
MLPTACITAQATRVEQMSLQVGSPNVQPVDGKHVGYRKVTVASVQGGKETNPLLATETSNADFKAALEASLNAFNFLATDNGGSKYKIAATITKVDQPMVGLDLSVIMTVRYIVTSDTGEMTVDETITSTGTATVSDAYLGVERLQLAQEKSARGNIEVFLMRLTSKLR